MARGEREREYGRRYYARNAQKERERSRKYRAENPAKAQESQRRYRAARHEKILLAAMIRIHGPHYQEDFAVFWAAQAARCYLCQRDLDREQAHMDHDHRCCPRDASCRSCRRGLSCGRCNQLIGLADDDPDRLRLIAANLEAALSLASARLAGRPEQAELFPLRAVG